MFYFGGLSYFLQKFLKIFSAKVNKFIPLTYYLLEKYLFIILISEPEVLMEKQRCSLNLDVETIQAIEEAARLNHTSRSAIARMLLQIIQYVPVNQLRELSPVPYFFGINTGNLEEEE
jgi:hypothetical protein